MKVFLSYRRKDNHANEAVHRIYDELVKVYSRKTIFMDVDTIPIGQDFRRVLDSFVSRADVLLVLIGENWLDILRERAKGTEDYVRVEIESAIQRGIPIVPVLIEGATIPNHNDLPESIGPLAFSHAIDISLGEAFSEDADNLIVRLEKNYGDIDTPDVIDPRSMRRRMKRRRLTKNTLISLISLILVGSIALHLTGEEKLKGPESGLLVDQYEFVVDERITEAGAKRAVGVSIESALRGQLLMMDRDYHGAIDQFRNAIDLLPDWPETADLRTNFNRYFADACLLHSKDRLESEYAENHYNEILGLMEEVLRPTVCPDSKAASNILETLNRRSNPNRWRWW